MSILILAPLLLALTAVGETIEEKKRLPVSHTDKRK